jgi:hypothetical protein
MAGAGVAHYVGAAAIGVGIVVGGSLAVVAGTLALRGPPGSGISDQRGPDVVLVVGGVVLILVGLTWF